MHTVNGGFGIWNYRHLAQKYILLTLWHADFYALDSVDFTLILKHLSQGWEIKWNWLFDAQKAAKCIWWNADVIQIPKVFVFYARNLFIFNTLF